MIELKAYKCDRTRRLFEDERDARKSEFVAMMAAVGGSLPAMGSLSSKSIMEWLAREISGGVYPNVERQLSEALAYYAEHLRKK